MVISCCAYGCLNRQTSSDQTLKFHRFPHNRPELLLRWKIAIRRQNWEPTRTSHICSEHFTEDDYRICNGVRHRLKRDAVPSIFDFSPEQYKKLKGKRKSIQTQTGSANHISREQIKIKILQTELLKLKLKHRLLQNVSYRQKILICRLNSQINNLTEEILNIQD